MVVIVTVKFCHSKVSVNLLVTSIILLADSARYLWRLTGFSKQVGDYRRGKRDGFGAYSFPNGDRYLGQYKADLPHGKGVRSTSTKKLLHE